MDDQHKPTPGRNPEYIALDYDKLKALCGIQCTKREVSAFLGMSDDTLERRLREDHDCTWTEYFEKYRGGGRISLRRKQMEIAKSGNVTMLIWLGKQYLGQADKQETETNLKGDGLTINYSLKKPIEVIEEE